MLLIRGAFVRTAGSFFFLYHFAPIRSCCHWKLAAPFRSSPDSFKTVDGFGNGRLYSLPIPAEILCELEKKLLSC